MSRQSDKTLVAQIVLDSNTYYVTDRHGITLDGTEYKNAVTSWGVAEYLGNIGQGHKIGSLSMSIVNGELFADNGYIFDVTDVWNNQFVTVKIWTAGITTWAGCKKFAKGILKQFEFDTNSISFSVEYTDQKDSKMLPSIVVKDQSDDAVLKALVTGTAGSTSLEYDGAGSLSGFFANDAILITDGGGSEEINQISGISGDTITVKTALKFTYSNVLSPYTQQSYMHKVFQHPPEDSIGKTVPIQIGRLDDTEEGLFAKGILVNDQIGKQIVLFDTIGLESLDSIGIWDDSIRVFFEGRKDPGDTNFRSPEYTTNASKNGIDFRIIKACTLGADLNDTSGIEDITVSDYTTLDWEDETTIGNGTDDYETYPELLSTNIMSIGRELMLIIQKPTSNTVSVERGYGGTTVEEHSAGDVIYQSAKFSSKNLLTFLCRFPGKTVQNHCFNDAWNDFTFTGIWSNLLDKNTSTSISLTSENPLSLINFDLAFDAPEKEYTAYEAYIALKADFEFIDKDTSNFAEFGLYDIFETTARDEWITGTNDRGVVYVEDDGSGNGQGSYSIDNWDSLDRDARVVTVNNMEINTRFDTATTTSWPGDSTKAFRITSTNDLKKKWKFYYLNGTEYEKKATFYALGVWVEFFAKFDDKRLVGPTRAREITSDVVTICGDDAHQPREGELCEDVPDVLALLLTQELGYTTSDFTESWKNVRTYYASAWNFQPTSPTAIPKVAFSYGIGDSRVSGWDFVQTIASHYNLMVMKDYDGKIDIVNLHEIYYNTPEGSEIKIEDVLFLTKSSKRRMAIAHTGVDLIYNDFIVKWKRNNSTDKYQDTYILPDDYTIGQYVDERDDTLPLIDARDKYYGGAKRTFTIESPYIYSEADAKRKAEWEADDKAESHLYVKVFIDYDHYTEINGLSEQYKIGDIVYFTGKHAGISFLSTNKFYIETVRFPDGPREVEIHAKSIQPVGEFTSV